VSGASDRFRKRANKRGFAPHSALVECGAIMGWSVCMILAEKYLDDGTRARRAAEDRTETASVVSAFTFCALQSLPTLTANIPGLSVEGIGGVNASVSIDLMATGVPQAATQIVGPLIAGLGLQPLKTLPYYFNPFQATSVISIGSTVQAAQPLGFTSQPFRAQRTSACLEKSLDLPGAPWINLRLASMGVFVTNILGYK
jgi:hypothetical protein